MMQLKELYDAKGNKRMYREDENGNLHVYFKDIKEKLIIREFYEEDASSWVNAMMPNARLDSKHKKALMDSYKRTIGKRREDDLEYSLIVTTHTGKILGEIDISPAKENGDVEAEVVIALKDELAVKQKGEGVIRSICRMHKLFAWYDKLYLKDGQGQIAELDVIA